MQTTIKGESFHISWIVAGHKRNCEELAEELFKVVKGQHKT